MLHDPIRPTGRAEKINGEVLMSSARPVPLSRSKGFPGHTFGTGLVPFMHQWIDVHDRCHAWCVGSDVLEWLVSGGPAYQYSQLETVEAGQADTAKAAAAVLQTSFKADITQRLKFLQTFSATITSEEAGLYSHHAVTTLEFALK